MTREPMYFRKLIIAIVLIFVVILVTETIYIASLWTKIDELNKEINTLNEELSTLRNSVEPISLKASLLVKYDNGTRRWYNNTLVPIGWTLFNLTLYVTGGKVDYQTFPFGVFIVGINGVKQHGNRYWFWYRWDPETRDWVLGETGADAYVLKRGDVLAWYLADTSSWPPAKP